ncbi:MAG: hypothetical protein IPL49_05445 [Saprospirales bacterium]|nr:hypothetical protein [Saprospirales bacterium]MBK8490353.1 hypothetical protein [Saprospirales bacterium]
MLYSNLWIALNATAQVAQTQYLLDGHLQVSPALGFVFFGTLFIYALHRISGLKQLAPFTAAGRFKVISEHKRDILVYAVIGLVGASVFFFLFPWRIQLMLGIPGLIALGYVIPFGASRKRLRDFHFLKIFLIAIVWAWLTVWVPAAELNWEVALQASTWWMALERAAFIFAITVPFDIRDLEVDLHTQVKTLPSTLGTTPAIILSMVALVAMIALAGWNAYTGFYPHGAWMGLTLSALLSGGLVLYSRRVEHDYYFSGLLDGMMIVQFLLVWGWMALFA